MGNDTAAPSTGQMGGLGTGLQIAGVLGQAFGAYKKSAGEKTAYEFQSTVAKRNKGIAELQATDALLRGQQTENAVRHKTAALKSTQVATMAARNLDLGSGSPLDILTSTDYMGEVDALKARDNAAKEAWGYNIQAQNYDDNASLMAWRADQQSPMMDAAGTLLTGAGTVASSWYAMRNRTAGTPTV